MKYLITLLFVFTLIDLTGCSKNHMQPSNHNYKEQSQKNSIKPLQHSNDSSYNSQNFKIRQIDSNINKAKAIKTVSQPTAISVLVDKEYFLPKNYVPKDLVYPNVSFIFKEKIEKRKMRKEAARALERLFAGAKKDKIYLSGVSAYRSYKTQKAIFNRYVKVDGYTNARKYSAIPGSSEHQTGLAIDVSSSTGKCAATSCFSNTKEAKWLENKSTIYGFIIRYPKGKESITGYKYEPWHIRYVGVAIAKEIKKRNITLEEYLKVYPVSK
ncbi:D-alanyl-D-alanine carboxypeptidase family protein [Gottfriedia sp. NPDC057991]|uniref:M15 family metallopeptidase n=1 Tax=Gottfriedia sp. NPDC057991 TaxID=3346298 RepID=UPI0036DDDDB4